jgi:RNA polymerase sigma-70 factor (ECF subfamily)
MEHAVPFAEVAQELSQPLLRYLQRYVGDRGVADDLLQETLIRIARGLPGFSGASSVKTWAFSIATRVAADHFRQPANRARIVEFDESPELADPDPAIDQQLVIDEMNGCIRQLIDSLPADYRAALVLHDLQGLTVPQAAEICGCSVPTAKIRIHRARLRLGEALQQACEFYRDRDNVLRCDRKP